MWSRRRRSPTLAGQFLLLQLAVIAVVLGCVAVVSLLQADADFRSDRGSRVVAVATNLANTPLVRDTICGPACRPSGGTEPAEGSTGDGSTGEGVVLPNELAFATDRAVSLSGADVAWLTDAEGRVLVSTDPTSVGRRIDLGASDVQQGRAWRGEVDLAGSPAIAGHVPLLDDDGQLVGIAAVAQDLPSWGERFRAAAPDLGLFLGLAALLGVTGTTLLSQLIKRRTRGLEPAEIASLADHREALLHSIREGVVAVGVDGVVTVANDSARALLDLPADVVGRHVDGLGLAPAVREVLLADDTVADATLVVGDRIVVANRSRVTAGNRLVGTVTTLRDRSELLALQSRVDTHRTITDTLRAQTHEFANQLHTISGLVQLREYDEVTELVGDLTRRRAAIVDEVAGVVEDPLVSALLVAKSSLAAEAGVRLEVTTTAPVPRLARELSGDVTTVLGNLVDNALDVSRSGERVVVTLTADDDAIVVEVADSGPGVPEALSEVIFERGWSSKPDVVGGRGIGLALVQMVCARRGGSVRVDNSDGAVFRAVLPTGTVGA